MRSLASTDDHLANLVGAFVSAAQDRLTAVLEQETGLAGSGPAAVLAIDTWSGCSIDFLRRVLHLTHSGAVRLVARLCDDGWVARGPGVDGRTAALTLTSTGHAVAARLRACREEVMGDFVNVLPREQRRGLAAALEASLRAHPRTRIEAQRACRLCDHTNCRGSDCPIGSSVDGE